MRFLALFIPLFLFAVSSEDIKLEIGSVDKDISRFKLVITAPTPDLGKELTLEIQDEKETKLIVLEQVEGGGLYSAVDYLPEASSKRRFFLRGVSGTTEAVMIKFIVVKK